jgi:hypothetical protein
MPLNDPGRGCPSSVRFVATGLRDAMLTVTGNLDDALVERCIVLLQAACGTGVRHMIVDISAVAGSLPARWAEVLKALRRDLEAGGGWLIVDGAAGRVVAPEPDLTVLFDAYRRTRADQSGRVRSDALLQPA